MSAVKKNAPQKKLLISSCLLGERVRYDGKINKVENHLIKNWLQQGIILPVCPEVCGGLPIPRSAAERQDDGSIKTQEGTDVTAAFQKGAEQALSLALQYNIKIAVLTEKSPSCGSAQIYNGRFQRTLINGQGLTAQLLRAHGIQVFNQFALDKVQALLTENEDTVTRGSARDPDK